MAKRKSVDLQMTFSESEGAVRLVVRQDGHDVLSYVNDEAPSVRVNGFQKLPITHQELLEKASMLVSDGDFEKPEDFLVRYEHGRRKEIDELVTELRRVLRKISTQAKLEQMASQARSVKT